MYLVLCRNKLSMNVSPSKLFPQGFSLVVQKMKGMKLVPGSGSYRREYAKGKRGYIPRGGKAMCLKLVHHTDHGQVK